MNEPICTEDGCLELALYGSYLPLPNVDLFRCEQAKKIGAPSLTDDFVMVNENDSNEEISNELYLFITLLNSLS